MLKALIDDAKSAAASFIETYLVKASVAVPFLIALGFATVAAGLGLTDRFGATTAFWLLAAGYCAIGLVAATLATMRQQQEEQMAAEAEAERERNNQNSGLGDLGKVASAAATGAGQLPASVLAALLANPTAPALAGARLVARNVPLVLLIALLALLLWRNEESSEPTAEEKEEEGESAAATANASEVERAEEQRRLREAA